MSLLPEYILQTVIVRGLRTFREDTRYLDQLLRNADQKTAAEMRDFLLTQKIDINLNFPKDPPKLPAIILTLKNESEAQAFLNDQMGVDKIPESMTYDSLEDSDVEVLGAGSAVSTLGGLGLLKDGPSFTAGATNNTIRISDALWNTDEWIVEPCVVTVLNGTGRGQTRQITGNNKNTLVVSPNWITNPDNTSVFEIRTQPDEIVGEPRSLYTREEAKYTERLGSIYKQTYQVIIMGTNPLLTIYLHAILKSVMTISRLWLEKQGIMNLQMSASDYMPSQDLVPTKAYMRVMNLDFLYHFDVFVGLTDLATEFRVVLEDGRDPLSVTLAEIEI